MRVGPRAPSGNVAREFSRSVSHGELRQRLPNFPTREFTPRAERTPSRPAPFRPRNPGVSQLLPPTRRSPFRKRQLGVRGKSAGFVSDPELLASKLSRSRAEG